MPKTAATNGRRRRTVAAPTTSASDGTAAAADSRLLRKVQQLIAENKSVKSENERLRTLLGRIEQALGSDSVSRRRSASSRSEAAPSPARGSGTTNAKARKKKRARRVVTDPVVIAKRQAALEKARQALAAKRAAAKAAT